MKQSYIGSAIGLGIVCIIFYLRKSKKPKSICYNCLSLSNFIHHKILLRRSFNKWKKQKYYKTYYNNSIYIPDYMDTKTIVFNFNELSRVKEIYPFLKNINFSLKANVWVVRINKSFDNFWDKIPIRNTIYYDRITFSKDLIIGNHIIEPENDLIVEFNGNYHPNLDIKGKWMTIQHYKFDYGDLPSLDWKKNKDSCMTYDIICKNKEKILNLLKNATEDCKIHFIQLTIQDHSLDIMLEFWKSLDEEEKSTLSEDFILNENRWAIEESPILALMI